MRRRLTIAVLSVSLVLSACDGDPSEPLLDRADAVSLLQAGGAAEAAPHSLPGLLYAAIRTVYMEQGPTAARALVRDLREVQERVRTASAGAGESTASGPLAVRIEELGIVVKVFGEGIAATTASAVRADMGRQLSEVRATALPVATAGRVRELLAHAESRLGDADEALRRGDALAALGHAVDAGALTGRVRQLLADTRRVPALQDLFEVAVARLREADGSADGAHVTRALVPYNQLQVAARDAVRGKDRQRAHEALRAVRAEQIAIVLAVLGSDAVDELLVAAGRGLASLDASLAAARRGGRDVARLARMSATARDMLARSSAASAAGDAATALDLAGHAAGLINSVRSALNP